MSIDELLSDCKTHVARCGELMKTIEESAKELEKLVRGNIGSTFSITSDGIEIRAEQITHEVENKSTKTDESISSTLDVECSSTETLPNKPWLDKALLTRLYVEENRSPKEIAELLKTKVTNVNNGIFKYKLKRNKDANTTDAKIQKNAIPQTMQKNETMQSKTGIYKCAVCGEKIVTNNPHVWPYKTEDGRMACGWSCLKKSKEL